MYLRRTGIIALTLMLVMTVFSLPGAAQEDANTFVDEIGAYAEELSTTAGNIHDETENIADDESLDDALRAKGEEVHLSSHNISHCAEELNRSVVTLKELLADPEANADAIKAEVTEINEITKECGEIIESKSDLVHELQSEVPETHTGYADNTHDYYHEAEAIVRDIKKSVGDLEESLGIGAAAAASVNGAVSTSLADLEENANLLLEEASKIHDETEHIADDESLSEDIRAVGEEIHLSSHEIEHCADAVLGHVSVLEGLVGDTEANKAAIDEEIEVMNSNLTDCAAIISSNHDKLHELVKIVPETHTEYADNTHDYYHEAEYIVSDLQENVVELLDAIENPVPEEATEAKSAPETEASEPETTGEEAGNSAPGFGSVFAIAGLLCMVFLAKRM